MITWPAKKDAATEPERTLPGFIKFPKITFIEPRDMLIILDAIPYNIGFADQWKKERHAFVKANTTLPLTQREIKFHVNTDNNWSADFSLFCWSNHTPRGEETKIGKYRPQMLNFCVGCGDYPNCPMRRANCSFIELDFEINESGILEVYNIQIPRWKGGSRKRFLLKNFLFENV